MERGASKDGALSKVNDRYASVLISDRHGSYFSQGIEGNHTFYHGMACRFPIDEEWTMFKFIERIDVKNSTISKREDTIIFTSDEQEITARFCAENTLSLECQSGTRINISLDPRKIYDFSRFGRHIKVYEEEGYLIAEYEKKDDEHHPYRLFLGVKGIKEHKFSDEWVPRDYGFDRERSGNGEWFVNEGLELITDGPLKIVQHHDKRSLIKRLHEDDDIINDNTGTFDSADNINDEDITSAYKSAVIATEELSVKDEGLYAGYYWFFQFWTRDEAISLGGLIKEGKKDLTRTIIKRHLSSFLDDGRISNRFPHSMLGSADGTGWSILRLEESSSFFSEEELGNFAKKIEYSVHLLEKNYMKDGLFRNAPKETWMDTNGETSDVRSGFRIEIQALMMRAYSFLSELTKNESYLKKMDNLRHATRELLFDGEILADGAEDDMSVDKTLRPNVFLAYYIFPDMLEEEAWEKAFNSCLGALWLEWGGLATIDKSSPLFKEEYTGENDESYHRGDSWFFVNNLAAIAMHRLDKEKYSSHIKSIIRASTHDILHKGMIGAASEISSAKEQRAEGAWQQAWSCCTFIELIHEAYGNGQG